MYSFNKSLFSAYVSSFQFKAWETSENKIQPQPLGSSQSDAKADM